MIRRVAGGALAVALAAIVGLLFWTGTQRESAGKDAEARAAAAAARAESAAVRAQVRVQRIQAIDTFLSLRTACARGNLRASQTNAAIVELRGFVLDAAAARQATGDPAVAERYRMRAARLSTLPLVNCSEAYPLPRGVTAAQARARARALDGAGTRMAMRNSSASPSAPPTPAPRRRATPAPATAPRGTPAPSPTPRPVQPTPVTPAPTPQPTPTPPPTPPATPTTPAAPASPTAALPIIGPVVRDALPVVPQVVDPVLCRLVVACPRP